MSIPNFGNQMFCKYRQPPQPSAAATYVIDVSKAFLGALLGCLLALAIWSVITEYRVKAKMRGAMQEMQQEFKNLQMPQIPQVPQ